MQLNYYASNWQLNEKQCPCDIHFAEYCRDYGIRDQSVFHFGTGAHHYLGLKNLELELPNDILAVTASKEEHQAYVDLIVENPLLAIHYKVLYCDIYTLTPKCLPAFDVVSLFHLCEYRTAKNSAYTSNDDGSLLRLFLAKLNPEGQILVYRRSAAYAAAKVLIDRMSESGEIIKLTDYKTITSYRKKREP
jgi:hypothetical protein